MGEYDIGAVVRLQNGLLLMVGDQLEDWAGPEGEYDDLVVFLDEVDVERWQSCSLSDWGCMSSNPCYTDDPEAEWVPSSCGSGYGIVLKARWVYHYPDGQVTDPLQELLREGQLFLPIHIGWDDGKSWFLELYPQSWKPAAQGQRGKWTYRLFVESLRKDIFSGDDFDPGPLRISPAQLVADLLGFLTLRPGDTDEEYFEKYTAEQLAWCQSAEAEELKLFAEEPEEAEEER
jgi:hypothetical protein